MIIESDFTESDSDYFQEGSITNSGSLSEPEYIVHFSKIQGG